MHSLFFFFFCSSCFCVIAKVVRVPKVSHPAIQNLYAHCKQCSNWVEKYITHYNCYCLCKNNEHASRGAGRGGGLVLECVLNKLKVWPGTGIVCFSLLKVLCSKNLRHLAILDFQRKVNTASSTQLQGMLEETIKKPGLHKLKVLPMPFLSFESLLKLETASKRTSLINCINIAFNVLFRKR